jgi:methionine-rich copper-binding protein CopC
MRRLAPGLGSAVLLALVLLVPGLAWPHAYLVKSSPARRAVLSRAPTEVQLWFNERLEPRFSRLSVWDSEGQQVDTGDGQVGPEPTRLSVRVQPLTPGSYTVKFRVLSVDSHVVEEQFSFTIRERR